VEVQVRRGREVQTMPVDTAAEGIPGLWSELP
jgi:hypothetical protein